MLSEKPGKDICVSEVTSIGRDGFWLLSGDCEYFVPYQNYPAFKQATVEQIYSMQEISPGQLHWEALDEDIEIAALEYPERFPLKFAA
jgi:ethanolamine utilization protein EutA (predicted chaperonin)